MALTKVKPGGIHADLSSAISGSANASAISGSHTSGFEFAGTVSGSSISTGSFSSVVVADKVQGNLSVGGNLSVTGTGGGNKIIYLPCLMGGGGGDNHTELGYGGAGMRFDGANDNSAGAVWGVPDDFTSLTSLKMIFWGHGNGDLYMRFHGQAVAVGEPPNGGADEDAIAYTTYASVASQTYFLDITAAWDGLTFGNNHWLGITARRDGTNANDTQDDNIDIMGFVVKYS